MIYIIVTWVALLWAALQIFYLISEFTRIQNGCRSYIFSNLVFLNILILVNILDQIQNFFDSALKIILLNLYGNLILLTDLKLVKTITNRLFYIYITTALQGWLWFKRILNWLTLINFIFFLIWHLFLQCIYFLYQNIFLVDQFIVHLVSLLLPNNLREQTLQSDLNQASLVIAYWIFISSKTLKNQFLALSILGYSIQICLEHISILIIG